MNTERKDGVLVAKPEGRIDGVNARDFHDALSEAIGTDSNPVIVDLADINYISSAGLRTFLLIAKTLQQRSAPVCAMLAFGARYGKFLKSAVLTRSLRSTPPKKRPSPHYRN